MSLTKSLECKSCEKQLRELELFNTDKSGLREDPIALFNYLTRGFSDVSLGSSPKQQNTA